MKINKAAVIIPTYGEAENIAILIKKIFNYCPQINIVVVDDNSPDQTQKIVTQLQKKYKSLDLVARNKKAGRGSAVLAGFAHALKKFKADYYLEMDADLSHPANQIKQLVNHCQAKTVVIASRYIKQGQIKNVPLFRKYLSLIANIYIKNYLQTGIKDNSNGFRCYPKKAIEIMLNHQFVSSGYIVLSETIMLLKKHGFKFKEIATTFINRKYGQSNADLKEFCRAAKGLREIKKLSYNNKDSKN